MTTNDTSDRTSDRTSTNTYTGHLEDPSEDPSEDLSEAVAEDLAIALTGALWMAVYAAWEGPLQAHPANLAALRAYMRLERLIHRLAACTEGQPVPHAMIGPLLDALRDSAHCRPAADPRPASDALRITSALALRAAPEGPVSRARVAVSRQDLRRWRLRYGDTSVWFLRQPDRLPRLGARPEGVRELRGSLVQIHNFALVGGWVVRLEGSA